jgi:hypothetical protein
MTGSMLNSNKHNFHLVSLRFLFKSFFKNNLNKKSKIKEISSLLQSFLILILEKAKKIADVTNRIKVSYYDLINSINENQIFSFNIVQFNNYRVFSKNKKILINKNRCVTLLDEILKESLRKKQSPLIIQNWYRINGGNNLKIKKKLHDKIHFNLLRNISFEETMFLCYIFKTIFNKKKSNRKLCLKVVSDKYNFRNISKFFFLWIVNRIFTKYHFSDVLTTLRIFHAIVGNNWLFTMYFHKQVISVCLNLICYKIPNKIAYQNLKILFYSQGMIKFIEKKIFEKNNIFFLKKDYLFLKKFLRNKNIKKLVSLFVMNKYILNYFTKELFLCPVIKK